MNIRISDHHYPKNGYGRLTNGQTDYNFLIAKKYQEYDFLNDDYPYKAREIEKRDIGCSVILPGISVKNFTKRFAITFKIDDEMILIDIAEMVKNVRVNGNSDYLAIDLD